MSTIYNYQGLRLTAFVYLFKVHEKIAEQVTDLFCIKKNTVLTLFRGNIFAYFKVFAMYCQLM